MPFFDWQVSTERMRTRSIPASSIFFIEIFGDFFVGLNQDFVGDRIDDVVEGHATEDTVAHLLDDFAAFDQSA